MNELNTATTKLFWSLWSELGAPGGGRAHQRVVIDPELLIAFTPHFAEHDNRLLGLAFDWCAANAAHVSKSRLLGISKLLPIPALGRLADFNSALAEHGVQWKPQGEPLSLERDRERVAVPVERPALLAFRVRAIAGVSVRADLLTRLLFATRHGASAGSLTAWGSSRRGVERLLTELVESGQVLVHGTPRKRRFRLRDHESLAKLTRAEGLEWWEWHVVFTLLARVRELAEPAGLSPRAARVRAVTECKQLGRWAAELGTEPPPRVEGREDALEVLSEWWTSLAGQMADGVSPAGAPNLDFQNGRVSDRYC